MELYRAPNRSNTTIPWSDKELVVVNGHRLAYRFNAEDEMEVLMPGWADNGGSLGVTASALKRMGFVIEYPRIARL